MNPSTPPPDRLARVRPLRAATLIACGTLLAAPLAVAPPAASAQDGDDEPEPAAASAGDTDPSKDASDAARSGLGAMAALIAKDRVHRDVVYPSFEKGILESVVTAGEMTRYDEESLDIVRMTIELYDAQGRPDYTIRLRTADYHMPSEQLASESETVIEGRSFTLRGDRMVFDSATRRGRLEGNIEMRIFDVAGFSEEIDGTRDETAPATPPNDDGGTAAPPTGDAGDDDEPDAAGSDATQPNPSE